MTRQIQVSRALLEAIADDLLPTGAKVVAIYTSFDKDALDTVSIISLTERLARLTRRDLQRLETSVPLDTLRASSTSPSRSAARARRARGRNAVRGRPASQGAGDVPRRGS